MNCKQGTAIILSQISDLLENLSNEQYRQPLELFNGSSLGQHVRHILDFYYCLVNGIECGKIDYSLRERNPLIENDTQYARQTFHHSLDKVNTYCETDNIKVIVDFSADESIERPFVSSSIGRELMYAYDHAVHHLAMVKMGLRTVFPNVTIHPSIGIAPSTLKHWKAKEKV